MLPVDTGSYKLTDESRKKLDFFYRKFCEGKNGRQYGIGHIVYACHASFPLLLSPELANLTWLNFNTYIQNGALKKMDRIVISDLLLSSLVRPVANRQLEIIPEIRNYLLHLLKDDQWFNLYGIEQFGDKRLESLAQFLRQYLVHKRSNDENIASGFKEINEWTALAYLEPNALAYNIFEAYKKTFDTSNDKKVDEYGQLRLNLLMDKFRKQIDMELHQRPEEKPAAFINLHTYSRANKNRLFEIEEGKTSDLLIELDPNFIAEKTTKDSGVFLPVKKESSERLKRKSKGITRLFTLIIAIDEYADKTDSSRGRVRGAEFLAQSLQTYAGSTDLEIKNSSIKMNGAANYKDVLQELDNISKLALPEDTILIYLSGNFSVHNNKEYFVCNKGTEPESVNTISGEKLNEHLSRTRSTNKTLILDGDADWRQWKDVADILITSKMTSDEQSLAADYSEGFMCLLPYFLGQILSKAQTPITNKDLNNLLRFKINSSITREGFKQTPSMWIRNESLHNTYFLNNKSQPNTSGHLTFFDESISAWIAIDEAFKPITLNKTTEAYDYETGTMINEVKGELHMRDNKILFSGQLKDLDHRRLYKAVSQKDRLCYMISPLTTKTSNLPETIVINDHIESKIVSDFSSNNAFDFSIWSSIKKIDTGEKPEYPMLQIDRQETDINKYDISLFQSSPTIEQNKRLTVQSPAFKWQVNDIEKISPSIKNFIKYNYTSSLQLYPKDSFRYSNFEVEIKCKWDNEEFYTDRLFAVTQSSFYIKDGQIFFNSFFIEISSYEEFPIFYDIYLITSDFSIEKVEKNKDDIIESKNSTTIRIDKNELFHRILERQLIFTIKVLLSKNPITIDLSQKPGY